MFSSLPLAGTPLNQHSLAALELWLEKLGAERSQDDPCLWFWTQPEWFAEIQIDQDELIITWKKEGKTNQSRFSYGLPRQDVESAMIEGPLMIEL